MQLIDSIESIHNLGFTHCDLKPQNIMVGYEGSNSDNLIPLLRPQFKVYLIDFGLCVKYIKNMALLKSKMEEIKNLPFAERMIQKEKIKRKLHYSNKFDGEDPMSRFKGNLLFQSKNMF